MFNIIYGRKICIILEILTMKLYTYLTIFIYFLPRSPIYLFSVVNIRNFTTKKCKNVGNNYNKLNNWALLELASYCRHRMSTVAPPTFHASWWLRLHNSSTRGRHQSPLVFATTCDSMVPRVRQGWYTDVLVRPGCVSPQSEKDILHCSLLQNLRQVKNWDPEILYSAAVRYSTPGWSPPQIIGS